MELEYKRVESFEVKGLRFHFVSKWNGLEEWRDDKDRMMIVYRGNPGAFAEVFGEIFGAMHGGQGGGNKLHVVSASPDLALILKA